MNNGYHDLNNLILDKANNIKIKDLSHLKEVIDESGEKYIILDFIGEQRVVLDSEKIKASIDEIMKKYNINTAFYLGDG